jgi:hypothetical protein
VIGTITSKIKFGVDALIDKFRVVDYR